MTAIIILHVIACYEIYYLVLQFHYMSLHRGGFRVADSMMSRPTAESRRSLSFKLPVGSSSTFFISLSLLYSLACWSQAVISLSCRASDSGSETVTETVRVRARTGGWNLKEPGRDSDMPVEMAKCQLNVLSLSLTSDSESPRPGPGQYAALQVHWAYFTWSCSVTLAPWHKKLELQMQYLINKR